MPPSYQVTSIPLFAWQYGTKLFLIQADATAIYLGKAAFSLNLTVYTSM